MNLPRTMMTFFLLMFSLAINVALVTATTAAAATTTDNKTFLTVDQCRVLGFDPDQLSCDTCHKLSSWLSSSSSEQTVLKNCLSCCQIYRDIPRAQPQRYQAALLIHATGQNEHLDNLINNDKFEETVKSIKGSHRFRRIEVPSQAAMMIPSHLYWLDRVLEEDRVYDLSSLEQYESQAKETITLDPSWKTDDIRDMILTLLADK